MYSLLVSNEACEKNDGTVSVEKGRFLEYTNDLISVQLQSLSAEAKESIRSWPCILMQEGRGQEHAHLVAIRRLDATGQEIVATLSAVPEAAPMLNDFLWRLRDGLDIGDFEFSRNHWAIKDRDLFATLAAAGHTIDPAITGCFEQRPLPAPRRPELLRARNVMSEWGHTEIDDFLLEAGVNGLAAGREFGSRRDRANAIVQFIFDHPSATTAENSLLSAFLVKQATGKDDEVATSQAKSKGETAAASPVSTSPFGDEKTEHRDTAGGKTGEGRETTGVFGDEKTEHTNTAGEKTGESRETTGVFAPEMPFSQKPSEERRSPNTVFVVHGQNQAARNSVVAFLEAVGLRGIVLHEQPNMGRHLLTKFIEEAELITFAVVLMTDDDMGGLRDATLAPRARQNVILELGYFLSHLGQRRVCALITPGLETPSDFDGIVYIRMDESGLWKTELTRELRAAGMPLIEDAASTCSRAEV